MLTGGAFANATLFAMGITPYINSSIIIQLLTVAIPALERMAKEGEEGRKKIAAITRYTTVGLGLIQGTAYYFYLRNNKITLYNEGFSAVFTAIIIVLTFTAGTALIMWMGEQINQKGVGNGISIILFAGIVARLPVTMGQIWSYFSAAMQSPESYGKYFVFAPLFIILFLAVIWVIVFMNDSERRIPVQYAKKVVGRKVYGGQSTFLPIKVTMSGVMPVIFASAILSIPSTIRLFVGEPTGFWKGFFNAFSSTGWLYSVLYLLLIVVFAYFYMTIQYNPIEMANNLRTNNGTIPVSYTHLTLPTIRPSDGGVHQQDPFQDNAHRRDLPRVRCDPADPLQQPHRYVWPFHGRHVRHHHGWRCAGDCKADRISDDDASLQGLP